MRVTTAFNQVLSLEGAVVAAVSFEPGSIVVGVRRRARRHRCPCGVWTKARYDASVRRWRHLDFAATKVFLEAEIARIACRRCGRVRTEDVPWARPGAHCSRDFEDTVAWLAQRMDKSAIATLMRCAWATVDRVVKRLVTEHLDAGRNTGRLEGLLRIGVDEISYKRGHHYLTVVADHDTGAVVWVTKGRKAAALEQFIDQLGPDRARRIEAVSMDMSPAFTSAAARRIPHARVCLDPFHVMKMVNQAMERVLDATRSELFLDPDWKVGQPARKLWRRARFLVRSGHENLDRKRRRQLAELCAQDTQLGAAWRLKERFRRLYQLPPHRNARRYLQRWCQDAARSGISAFATLAIRVRVHFKGILAAVELGLSNSRLEGINSKIRVIQRRGYGHRDPDALRAMIFLCLGGITIDLPTSR